jgi:hypothetical protein
MRTGTDWDKVAKFMRDRPNEWVLVGEFSPGIANHIRSGGFKQFIPEGVTGSPKAYMKKHFEITTRRITPRQQRVHIYGRFLG